MCLVGGLAALTLQAGAAHAQGCTVGGQVGAALGTDVPYGDSGDIEAGAGFSAALDLVCGVGAIRLGLAPEMHLLSGMRTQNLLAGVGVRLPLGSRAGAVWIQPMLQAGLASGDHDTDLVPIGISGRHVDFPSGIRPAGGAVVRLGIPMEPGHGFVELAIRVTSFPTIEGGEAAGDHAFVLVPLRIGYAFRP